MEKITLRNNEISFGSEICIEYDTVFYELQNVPVITVHLPPIKNLENKKGYVTVHWEIK